jgi:hypothetical protein
MLRDDSMDALENSSVKGPMFGAQTQVAAHNTFVFRPMKGREEANLLRSSPIHHGQAADRVSPHQRKAKGRTLTRKRWSSAPYFSASNLKNGMKIKVQEGNQRPA